jgi:cytochrome c553
VPNNAATPIIWGQQENYLIKQLHDFHSDARNSEVMKWMATALTQAELQAAATYFSKKGWPATTTSAAGGASPPALLAVCQACHQLKEVRGLRQAVRSVPRLEGGSGVPGRAARPLEGAQHWPIRHQGPRGGARGIALMSKSGNTP